MRTADTTAAASRWIYTSLAMKPIVSAVAGIFLVVAGFRFSVLNWIVDAPGSLVSRFTSINFHEGEGAFGFFLAIFLAWLWTAVAVWLALYGVQRVATRKRGGISTRQTS